jgi:HK97 family phage major capsid protein
MSDEIKVGRLARDMLGAEIVVRKQSGAPVQLTFSLSSESPVERWFGTNHNWDDPVGMLTAGRIEGGRLVVDAQMFDTDRAREVARMVDGGLRTVSVGYEIRELTEDVKKNVFTATRWMPLEGSIATIPADPSVGIGRSAEETKPVRITRASPESFSAANAVSTRSASMAEVQAAEIKPVVESTPRIEVVEDHTNRPNPVEFERSRKSAILNLCKANRLDERYARAWIENGTDLEDVSKDMLNIIEERGRTTPQIAATHLDMPQSDVRKYSLMRALRASANKDWTAAGLELEANKEITKRLGRLPRANTSFFVPLDVMLRDRQQRVQTRDWTVAGVNGSNYLVSTDNQPGNFIELLRNTSVSMRAGVRTMAGLVGNVTIPKMTAGTTAYWLSDENTAITEANPTLGQVALTPKNVAALTEISHQLMSQSTPDAEQMLLDSIARDIALAVDIGVIRGSNANGQPQGIVGTSGLGAFTGTSLASPGILDAMSDVAAANALGGSLAYVTTAAVAKLLMDRPELTTAGTTRLWTGSMLEGSMFGVRAFTSAQIASATMLFGDWSTVILGEWGVLELMTNPYSDFTRGLTAVRGWYTCDVAMRYPAAFSYASSIT